MNSNRIKQSWWVVGVAGLALLLSASVFAQGSESTKDSAKQMTVNAGQKSKLDGVVADRDADSFLMTTSNGSELRVKLTADTEIREKKANPFRGSKKYTVADVVRGLDVEVEGQGDSDGALVAKKIRFTQDDVKVARSVDSRVTPVEGRVGTAETRLSKGEERLTASEDNAKRMSGQIEELDAISNAARGGAKAAQDTADKAITGVAAANDRITSLDDYEAVQSVTVHFKINSAVLSDEAQKSLDDLAGQTAGKKGYVIEVAGFASKDGNDTYNRMLSERRAEAVRQYLAEKHDIPLRRIITPLGYGASHPVAENTSRTGRQENRRTEVRILVSKGFNSASNTAAESSSANASLRNQ